MDRAERRAETKYYVISEEQLERIATKAAIAGGKAAVDDFVALLGRNTLKNVGILVASIVAVVTAWIVQVGHKVTL